jgi:hypothetical protein
VWIDRRHHNDIGRGSTDNHRHPGGYLGTGDHRRARHYYRGAGSDHYRCGTYHHHHSNYPDNGRTHNNYSATAAGPGNADPRW